MGENGDYGRKKQWDSRENLSKFSIHHSSLIIHHSSFIIHHSSFIIHHFLYLHFS